MERLEHSIEALIERGGRFGAWLHELYIRLSRLFHDVLAWIQSNLPTGDALAWIATAVTTFALIAAAEIGDKSQIVCMTLAARHRPLPILLGATSAFALLNLAAVLFGAAVAAWVPERIVALCVAVLFAAFGLHALRSKAHAEDADVAPKTGHSLFATTLLLIIVAEFGDKTQIAVAGLSSAALPAPVWLGATLALAMTSALGVWAGRVIFRRVPLAFLHKVSGMIFLILAMFALGRAVYV